MKLLIIVTCVFVCSLFIMAQTPQENLNKYWQYKERLKTKFMVSINVNSSNANAYQGINIPAARRNPTDYDIVDSNGDSLNPNDIKKNTMSWSDATCHMGHYIAILATEYKMLLDHPELGPPNAIYQTMQDLTNALWAIERLDDRAETYYGWSCTNEFEDCLNGFFIRDDVHKDFATDWAANGYAEFSNTPIVSSDFRNGEDNVLYMYDKEMSQDQVWNLLMGFALVKKFVDVPVIGDTPYSSVYGQLTYKDWVQMITSRILRHMQDVTTFESDLLPGSLPVTFFAWEIHNPTTNNLVDRGGEFFDIYPHAYLFAEAGNWINQGFCDFLGVPAEVCNFLNLQEFHYGVETHFDHRMPWIFSKNDIDIVVDAGPYDLIIKDGWIKYKFLLFPPVEVMPIPYADTGVPRHYNDKAKLLLATIAGIDYAASYFDLRSWLDQCANHWNSSLTGEKKELIFEHLPLMYLLLHDVDVFGTGMLTELYSFDYFSKIENLLNIAPPEGPWRFIYDIDGNGIFDPDDNPGMEWSVNNRLASPIGKNYFEATEVGEFNGLDYMLLHNLYLLTYYSQADRDDFFIIGFPIVDYGKQTDETPLNICVLQDLKVVGKHRSNSEVVYRAGNSITVHFGYEFEAELGAEITFAPDGYKNLSY